MNDRKQTNNIYRGAVLVACGVVSLVIGAWQTMSYFDTRATRNICAEKAELYRADDWRVIGRGISADCFVQHNNQWFSEYRADLDYLEWQH